MITMDVIRRIMKWTFPFFILMCFGHKYRMSFCRDLEIVATKCMEEFNFDEQKGKKND